jgi:hypothetical protein
MRMPWNRRVEPPEPMIDSTVAERLEEVAARLESVAAQLAEKVEQYRQEETDACR